MPEQKTAVVVDDEPITRMDLSQMLEEMGFDVVGDAADGFDAVELCRRHRPDVVLMDVKMPVFDGLTASETIIREELAGCVVLLTAFRDRELIERANDIGVTGYLVKPVEERLLLPTLEVAMAQAKRLRDAREETAQARGQLEDQKLLDRAKGVLAREKEIPEREAYRLLQQMAMDKRCSMVSLAKAVVSHGDQRETVNRAKEKLMSAQGLGEAAAYRRIVELAKEKGVEMESAARDILAGYPGRGC